MSKGIAVVLAVALAVTASALAFGNAPANSAATNAQLAKRVKSLERRVRALALLQLRDDGPTVTSFRNLTSSRGNDYWQGTATCGTGQPVAGGAQFPSNVHVDDALLESYPNANGWTVFARARGGYPWVWVTCISE